MKKSNQNILKKQDTTYNNMGDIICVAFSIIFVYFIVWAFTGMSPWESNPYNSYTLQAYRWLSGHLDLGQNYSHLEIAEYSGKYFISFPPFPSYIMLPFALFFGQNTPDGFIALAVSILGAIYTLKLLYHFGKRGSSAIFWTLFLVVGSNMVFVSVNGWVWFIAQNMCFSLMMMSLYYATNAKGGISLVFWACSVGCRPLQIIYIPVLLYILYKALKEKDDKATITSMIKKNIKWVIVPILIALSYMILNYMRFGSIIEFGHNYLPEFVQADKGQFNISYIKDNFPRLFELPKMGEKNRLQFPKFNGMAFYLASPIFISYLIYLVRSFMKKEKFDKLFALGVLFIIFVHFISITAHKTMGGFQFGNRYTNDSLPVLFYALLMLLPKDDKLEKASYPLFMLGVALNVVGTIAVYNNWI